jgi:hypothetical protein
MPCVYCIPLGVDLRIVCDEDGDFANPVERSALAGQTRAGHRSIRIRFAPRPFAPLRVRIRRQRAAATRFGQSGLLLMRAWG